MAMLKINDKFTYNNQSTTLDELYSKGLIELKRIERNKKPDRDGFVAITVKLFAFIKGTDLGVQISNKTWGELTWKYDINPNINEFKL